VIVDLAAQQGGNCELTRPDEKSVAHDVSIIGYTDLPSRLPTQSSNLYANNIVNLLTDMTPEKDGKLTVDLEDVVVRHATVTHQSEVLFPAPKASTDTAAATDKPISQTTHWIWTAVVAVVATLLLWIVSTINIAGGFLVTHRMLSMFRKQA